MPELSDLILFSKKNEKKKKRKQSRLLEHKDVNEFSVGGGWAWGGEWGGGS